MKISFYIPKETKNISQFIQKELSSSQNIQDKNVRQSVEAGLKKIAVWA
mgnify:CR=1 FL=1